MTAEELLRRYAAGERDFTGVDLSYVSLRDFDLSEANFTNANLRGVRFTVAIMNSVNFSGADLSESLLAGEFIGCRFRSANLRGVDFSCSDVTGSNFKGADLTGADLTKGILCDAVYLENTTMPDGEVVVEGIDYIFWIERKFGWDFSS